MDNTSEEIKKQVFGLRPALKDIFELQGKETLNNYVNKSWQIQGGIPDKVFPDVFLEMASEIHGPELARTAAAQLAKKPLVSTVDHLGICSHPFFVNSDVIYSLAFKNNELPIVLATESVSLNNASSRSASFFYHQDGMLRHNSFLPNRLINLPVFSAPAIGQKDISRFNARTEGRFEGLINELELGQSSSAGLSMQAAHVSGKFWQKIFPSAPKIIYLPLETLVSKYLVRVLPDNQNFLHYLVMAKAGRGLWRKYFANEHTFMFWGIDERGNRQGVSSLTEKSDELLSLISNKKIYPASQLCFIVLLMAGLTCAGGFTQTTWLTEVKEKLLAMMQESGKGDAENIKNISTTNFAESSLAWLKIGGDYIPPSALDLYLSGKDYYPAYQRLSEKLTLGQSLELAMGDIYRVVVPKGNQLPEIVMSKMLFDKLVKEHL